MKKHIILIFIALCYYLSEVPILAQQEERVKLPFEFTVSAGAEINNFSNLNARLKDLGLDKTKPVMLSGGIGVAYDFNPVMLGTSISAGTSGFGDRSGHQSYWRGYFSSNRIRSGNIIFSPELGLGYQQLSNNVVKEGLQGEFNDFLISTPNQTRLEHKGTALDVGISLKKVTSSRIDPFLRIGYRHGLKSSSWKIQGADADNVPSDRISNVYVQLLLGIGR
ncbi:hypothetical protein FXV77_05360 [Sphingobacterium phlebotomi]|uniref:Outer membrane protein beta-barrel domain-containing protein n=1 Tax=Sphingobacterium phlebotomi TaxID=2605433 RepID=A0A5D4HB55_9SPHI|nr:hypothetical protein [Sphingobacterium phlebotomi]TYR37433.1 hypothetical protein FXV77_05360 [Sphingobacterium phlebotomi]